MTPQAHRTHGRLLDEPPPAGQLQQREIGVVDGEDSEEQDVTAEEAAAREAALEAERKAARDARYAARKKRK